MIGKENTINSDLIYTGKHISLRVDTVEVPKQGYKKREIIEHNGLSAIIGITKENKVLLIKRYRKSVEDVVLEVPSGKLGLNENPKECAFREFKEKTGYTAENFKLIHKFYSSVSFSNQITFIYLAKNIKKIEEKNNDEELIVEEIDFNEAYDMVLNNEIIDGKTSIAILISKNII